MFVIKPYPTIKENMPHGKEHAICGTIHTIAKNIVSHDAIVGGLSRLRLIVIAKNFIFKKRVEVRVLSILKTKYRHF